MGASFPSELGTGKSAHPTNATLISRTMLLSRASRLPNRLPRTLDESESSKKVASSCTCDQSIEVEKYRVNKSVIDHTV